MKIIHRFTTNSNLGGAETTELDDAGIAYEFCPFRTVNNFDQSGLIIFEVSEDHPRWATLEKLASTWGCTDIVRTEFNQQELEQAAWLKVSSNWHNGYPLPDDDFGYLNSTYGGTGCYHCGIGKSQQAPFSIRAEPKWGRRQMMMLHWVTDELFVSVDAYQTAFATFGIGGREVLHFKTSRPLKTVVQLCVEQTESTIGQRDYDEVCSQCGMGKHHWPVRGFFPRLDHTENLPMFKTKCDFGSGGSAGKAIIVSQELYRSLTQHRVKGCNFEPVSS